MKDYKQLADHAFDEHGRLKQYPSKRCVRENVLGRMAERFVFGKDYTEKEVNQIIQAQIAFSDIELIRRELIENAFLCRERDGSRYWKNERI